MSSGSWCSLRRSATNSVAERASAPRLEIEVGVVADAQRIVGRRDAQALERACVQPLVDDRSAALLVRVVLVEQREEREQRHLHLLRQRQPGGVVERDVAAVGHHAVDELQRLGRRA